MGVPVALASAVARAATAAARLAFEAALEVWLYFR